jgi:multidrug resistance efflux pump
MKRAILIGFFVVAVTAFAQPDDLNKVPDQFAVRLLKLKLDEAGLNNQMAQLQAQANQIVQTIQHDEGEVASITKEALLASKKDDTWTIDYAKMEYIAAPPPPAPPAAAKK